MFCRLALDLGPRDACPVARTRQGDLGRTTAEEWRPLTPALHTVPRDALGGPARGHLGEVPARFLSCGVVSPLVLRGEVHSHANRTPWERLTLTFGSPPGLWLTCGASVSMSTSALSPACPRSTWVQALRPACRRTPNILSIYRESSIEEQQFFQTLAHRAHKREKRRFQVKAREFLTTTLSTHTHSPLRASRPASGNSLPVFSTCRLSHQSSRLISDMETNPVDAVKVLIFV